MSSQTNVSTVVNQTVITTAAPNNTVLSTTEESIIELSSTIGPKGDSGKSAYAVALDNGFVGTELEWLNSLVGDNAYQSALDNGYTGTESEWIDSLTGKSAYVIALDHGFVGTEEEWLNSLQAGSLEITELNKDKFLTNNGTSIIWQDVTKTLVGLSNVDNTSDLDKPISTLTQLALDEKLNVIDLESELNNQNIVIDQGDL